MNGEKFKKERTLVLVKPDGVQRSLIGEVIMRLERMGLKLTAVKMVVPGKEMVEHHYTIDPGWRMSSGRKTIEGYKAKGQKPPSDDPLVVSGLTLERLINFMSSGPVVAMIWQGAHAVKIVRKIVGGTEPFSSDVGTIRGDFVMDSYEMADGDTRAIRNLVHASGSTDEAEKEINLWFKPEEVVSYRLLAEQMLYDVNLDGILE